MGVPWLYVLYVLKAIIMRKYCLLLLYTYSENSLTCLLALVDTSLSQAVAFNQRDGLGDGSVSDLVMVE